MTLSMVEEDGGGISFLSMRSEIPRASFQVAASNQPSDSTLHLDINHVVSLSQVIPQVVRWHAGCVDVHHLHACMANDVPCPSSPFMQFVTTTIRLITTRTLFLTLRRTPSPLFIATPVEARYGSYFGKNNLGRVGSSTSPWGCSDTNSPSAASASLTTSPTPTPTTTSAPGSICRLGCSSRGGAEGTSNGVDKGVARWIGAT